MNLKSGNQHRGDAENDTNLNVSDYYMDQEIKRIMTIQFDLKEIKEDPGYKKVVSEIKNAAHKNPVKDLKYKEREQFISGPLRKEKNKVIMAEEIKTFRYEMGKSNINEITAEWVNEWHRKKQNEYASKAKERNDFITAALKKPAPEESITLVHDLPITQKTNKLRINRYIATSVAAAVIAGVLLFTRLVPSSNSDKLFNSYYEPYEAISPVMRDGNTAAGTYSSAIMYYKAGDMAKAASYFEESFSSDPSLRSPVFYLGLTDLATGKYEDAIKRFTSITAVPGLYSKEAQWYLGLSYLKNGNIDSAKACFTTLAETGGYYMERSAEILRRLK